MGHLVVIAGHAGVGKTTLSRMWCQENRWALVDKDTVAGPLVGVAMEALTGDAGDRESGAYLEIVRAAEYQAALETAIELLDYGCETVVMTAPCSRPGDFDAIEFLARASGHTIAGLWVTCDLNAWRQRIVDRSSSRDSSKIVRFRDWVSSLATPELPGWMRPLNTTRWDRNSLSSALAWLENQPGRARLSADRPAAHL